MSRTKKGSKSPGSEHWSRRPKSFKDDKNLTVRAERAEAQNSNREAIKTFNMLLSLSDEEYKEYFSKLEDVPSDFEEEFQKHFLDILS